MTEKETYLIRSIEPMKEDQMVVCGTFAFSNKDQLEQGNTQS